MGSEPFFLPLRRYGLKRISRKMKRGEMLGRNDKDRDSC
nr:MAG TPA: hypothetical protein [Bacteriophage sp.]